MKARVVVRPEARLQVLAADDWWREHRQSAPTLFTLEFQEALADLGHTPDIGVSFLRRGVTGLRRLLMRRSKYHIYYVHEADEVHVLAVWSAHRGRKPAIKWPPQP